jgi:hypothetical protein
MKQLLLLTILIQFIFTNLFSQGKEPSLLLKRTDSVIELDGELNESAWFLGYPADGFWQYFPSDSSTAEQRTEIHMTYDDEFLYIGVKCYAISNEYITPSLRRDYSAGGSDNITLLFDTYNDQTNAFVFGINPYGVRREALISNGGTSSEDFVESWDNKWFGKSKIHDKYWVAEFAIPFKTLRFKDGSSKWRFNSYRFDTQINEISSWTHVPQNQIVMNLAYMGEMIWEEPLKKSGTNISIIPYVRGNIEQDFQKNNSEKEYDYDFGVDAKIGVTSGLNLDLTYNPDFSQVEVDKQVTDLSRFEIFFPERRQFFLENADLFSEFGNHRIKPFFSRRIGIGLDSNNTLIQSPIVYGARLSGKLDNNWRLGLLNTQTQVNEEHGLPGFNYTVAALQRKVFARSNIGVIMVNQQAIDAEDTEYDAYNRVIGIDYNLASSDNVWTGEFFYHQAITPADTIGFKGAYGTKINYQVRDYRVEFTAQGVGEGFDAQTGYVQRKNFQRYSPEFQYFFYPKKSKWLNRHSVNLDYTLVYQHRILDTMGDTVSYFKTDQSFTLDWQANLKDNSQLKISFKNNYVYLTDTFDASGRDSIFLAANTDYSFNQVSLCYQSDRRKDLSLLINPVIGQHYNGSIYSINGALTYAFRPYGSIAFNYSYNYIDLPEIQSSLILLGPRIDITFTKKIFLTTFLQYNNQTDNFNVNARLQWRFKPVSDFFLVYTDNYYASDFTGKDRAIVAKFTYWLNL